MSSCNLIHEFNVKLNSLLHPMSVSAVIVLIGSVCLSVCLALLAEWTHAQTCHRLAVVMHGMTVLEGLWGQDY